MPLYKVYDQSLKDFKELGLIESENPIRALDLAKQKGWHGDCLTVLPESVEPINPLHRFIVLATPAWRREDMFKELETGEYSTYMKHILKSYHTGGMPMGKQKWIGLNRNLEWEI